MNQRLKKYYNNLPPELRGMASGILWSLSGSLLAKVLPFIAWIIVAQILGKEQFGEYGIIRNTVLVFVSFAVFGLGTTGTKFIAEYYNKDKNKAGQIASFTLNFAFVSGSIICLSVILSANYLANDMLSAPWLKDELRIGAVVLLFSAYNGAQNGILSGLKEFKMLARVALLNSVFCFPLYICGAYGGVFWSVCAFALGHIIMCLQSAYCIRVSTRQNKLSISLRNGWKEWRILYSYSLPAALAGMVFLPAKWYSEVILVNASDFASLGIFSAAFTIHSIVLSVSAIISKPIISYLATYGTGNKLINDVNIILPWGFGFCLCMPLICFPEIGEIMFGADYCGKIFKDSFALIVYFTYVLVYNEGVKRNLAVLNLQWVEFCANFLRAIVLIAFLFLSDEKNSVTLSLGYVFSFLLVIISFYPIFIYKRWIPAYMMTSIPAIILWVLISAPLMFLFIDSHILIRFIYCLCSLLLCLRLFISLWRSSKGKMCCV